MALLFGMAGVASGANPLKEWLPVTDEERSLKAPTIDPEAGAEALFWHIHVADEDSGAVLFHYLRIKVFNQRGVEAQSSRDIEYSGNRTIADVAGRTIKPDGTIVELQKEAILHRDIAKAGGFKVKAVSFVMPAVEPGAIIEYRWREVRAGEYSNYVRMPFSRDIPVHEIKYFVRPLDGARFPMRLRTFRAQTSAMTKEKDGFSSLFVKNVPAYKEEPLMPSEWVVRPWTLVFYADDVKSSPDKYWASESKYLYELDEPYLKVNGDVRQAADDAIAGLKDPEAQLAKLLQYCRGRIKRFGDQDVTERQREKAKENNKPSDTLKRGIGSGFDVNMLFAAMARAEGFDVRVARLGDRSDRTFDKAFLNTFFLHTMDIAVKVSDKWRFYDAAAKSLPAGMLRWQEEGAQALVTDPKELLFVEAPFSEPEQSLSKRTGAFELDGTGTLQGDVRLAYTGHAAALRREQQSAESEARREDDIRDMVHEQFNNAEVSDVETENLDDPEKPLVYSYKVKVPGYAQRTGKRLFVQLAYFQHGIGAQFPASDRTNPVWFEYPWSEEDHLVFNVPPGFETENATAPHSFSLGPVGDYKVSVRAGQGRLLYDRTLVFGRGGRLAFPVQTYPTLKKVFDAIHDEDQHTLTLHQKAAGTEAKP